MFLKGAVIGPEEFFEGLALGTHQFIGGTFGELNLMLILKMIIFFVKVVLLV